MFRSLILMVLIALFSAGCARTEFTILSGSENQALSPILEKFAASRGVKLHMKYQGSIDIMLQLRNPALAYDAVWPAHSLWLNASGGRVKNAKSIMTSPVVFGIKKHIAQALGLTGKKVSVRDILEAIRSKKLRFLMTSASQSNSGLCAYLGFIHALLGKTGVIGMADLTEQSWKKEMRDLLSGVNRSSGSSGWLKDLFLKGGYDAMVNYECLLIEANQELVKRGEEPLVIIYPDDGMVLADSPLGFIDRENPSRLKFFQELQAFLLSEKTQREILGTGRRTGFGGSIADADERVFNPAWGIDRSTIITPVPLPEIGVIMDAIRLYQTELRKPSYTVFCLDFSGSMDGEGIRQLKSAMRLILDQGNASEYMLQASGEDYLEVIPFNHSVLGQTGVQGSDREGLMRLLSEIEARGAGGKTDIYSPVIDGLEKMRNRNDLDRFMPAIILMTDGESNEGKDYRAFEAAWRKLGLDIPVFAILFGDASEDQMEAIAKLTRGAVFDGRKDLASAFRKVKGYN